MPVLSLTFLLFALVHIGLWVWGWRAWATTGRPVALLIVLISNTLLWYDNFRIGMGHFIGQGRLLELMAMPAFIWHWTMVPLLIIAAGSIARLAGLGWARHRGVMGSLCVFAVALSLYDARYIPLMELHPACIADTIRYSTNVSPAQLCAPTDPVITGGAGSPLAAIIANVVVFAVDVLVWIRHRWIWLAAGSGAMFIAAGAFATSTYSLPISNFGEICIASGLIATCVHFARRKPSPA